MASDIVGVNHGALEQPDDPRDAGIGMHVRETVRTARYASLGAPPERVRRVWFALHGYGQLAARFLRPFAGVVPDDTLVIAPEGLSRFYHAMPQPGGAHLAHVGANWITREGRELDIADTMAWLDGVHDEVLRQVILATGHRPTCAVLGFSQGVATAMRWIAGGAVRPSRFVAWAGGLAADVDEDAFTSKIRDADVLLVAGERDRFVTSEAQSSAMSVMQRLQPTARALSFFGGHTLDAGLLSNVLDTFSDGTQ